MLVFLLDGGEEEKFSSQIVDKEVSTYKSWGHFVMQQKKRWQDVFDNSKSYLEVPKWMKRGRYYQY